MEARTSPELTKEVVDRLMEMKGYGPGEPGVGQFTEQDTKFLQVPGNEAGLGEFSGGSLCDPAA